MPTTIAKSRAEIFDQALADHSGAILHYLYSRCNDLGIAEDLSQTLWAYVHQKFTVEAMQQRGLIFHKAKQTWLDYYRKHSLRRPDLTFTDDLPEPIEMPFRQEPETADEDEALYERFWEIFYPDEYDETAKKVFWLHYRYGYTLQEISEKIGISKSTAHDKLIRLKAQCLERLETLNPLTY